MDKKPQPQKGQNTPEQNRRRKIGRSGVILSLLGLTMFILAFAFVPFYRTFCQWIGIPVPEAGVRMERTTTPKKVANIQKDQEERIIKVEFMGNSAGGVPVKLTPKVSSLKAKIGESALTAYLGYNGSGSPFKGIAIHTMVGKGVYTKDVAQYIDLVQCFCFDEQIYPAKERINLPLSFTIREDLPKDVHTITFGYTLYEYE